jgi:CheY-like chemotaxis protein
MMNMYLNKPTEPRKPYPLVMLVDDSSIDNFVNKKVIDRYSFASDVTVFTKATLALRHLVQISGKEEEITPSILFLDLDMPEINGFEFMDALSLLSQKIKENMKIVILTSSINPADVERCNDYENVLTFLHKPLMKNNLDLIDHIVSEKRGNLVVC